MKVIPLTQGKITIVDDDDYDYLSQWKWCYNGRYAVRGRNPVIRMHRLIMRAEPGVEIDHINRNRLDNRKTNLRPCSHLEQMRNVAKQSGVYSSSYKGVSFDWYHDRWRASIRINHILKHIGRYDTEQEAALAYNNAAIKFFGEFACLNIV